MHTYTLCNIPLRFRDKGGECDDTLWVEQKRDPLTDVGVVESVMTALRDYLASGGDARVVMFGDPMFNQLFPSLGTALVLAS
jgi:hypothetical protein